MDLSSKNRNAPNLVVASCLNINSLPSSPYGVRYLRRVPTALAESKNRFVPEVLVAGGGGAEGSIAGLAASLIQTLQASNHPSDGGEEEMR